MLCCSCNKETTILLPAYKSDCTFNKPKIMLFRMSTQPKTRLSSVAAQSTAGWERFAEHSAAWEQSSSSVQANVSIVVVPTRKTFKYTFKLVQN